MNDVEIPYGNATRFSLAEDAHGPFFAYRGVAEAEPFTGHHFRVLAAPLKLRASTYLSETVRFGGETFSKGAKTQITYRFDSYRVTYWASLFRENKWHFGAGATLKLRSAEIKLEQDGVSASSDNLGFVPLLHVFGSYQVVPEFGVEFDADALFSKYGRAEDISLRCWNEITPNVKVLFGYRMVEGGSSGTGGVYSFAWLHYASAAVRIGI